MDPVACGASRHGSQLALLPASGWLAVVAADGKDGLLSPLLVALTMVTGLVDAFSPGRPP